MGFNYRPAANTFSKLARSHAADYGRQSKLSSKLSTRDLQVQHEKSETKRTLSKTSKSSGEPQVSVVAFDDDAR